MQAVLFIARGSEKPFVPLTDISRSMSIPHHFLSKVLQTLVHQGLVISNKGSNGGFQLARSGNEITVYEIVRAIDGDFLLKSCMLGFSKCDDDNPCPLHDTWSAARKQIVDMICSKTIGELSTKLETQKQIFQTTLS